MQSVHAENGKAISEALKKAVVLSLPRLHELKVGTSFACPEA